MTKFNFALAISISFLLISCGQQSNNQEQGEGSSTSEQTTATTGDENADLYSLEKNGISLTPVDDSPQYPDASLTMASPTDNVAGKEVQFSFKVHDFELGKQTEDAATKGIANSDKGQHIHLILNNGPYSAHYEPEFKMELEDGHYVCLAFLSRSYHESVKSPGAFQLSQFTVGSGDSSENVDLTAPHLFYSRPKGTYKGKDAERILLDFFLYNIGISSDGNKVRATINGTPFLLTRWAPYIIQGVPMGELTVKLELIDKDGNLISSPFNPVERTIMLEPGDNP